MNNKTDKYFFYNQKAWIIKADKFSCMNFNATRYYRYSSVNVLKPKYFFLSSLLRIYFIYTFSFSYFSPNYLSSMNILISKPKSNFHKLRLLFLSQTIDPKPKEPYKRLHTATNGHNNG